MRVGPVALFLRQGRLDLPKREAFTRMVVDVTQTESDATPIDTDAQVEAYGRLVQQVSESVAEFPDEHRGLFTE